MREISGDIWPVPGTPGTLPGTRKHPSGAGFNNMSPVSPEKIKNLYMRAKTFCDRSNSKIKSIAYKMVQKFRGHRGHRGQDSETPSWSGFSQHRVCPRKRFLSPVSPVFEKEGVR